jgi:hypothetical protein
MRVSSHPLKARSIVLLDLPPVPGISHMTTSVAARDAQNSGKSILQDRVIVVQLSYRRPADGREGENDLLQAVTGRGRAGIGAELINSGWLACAKHGGGDTMERTHDYLLALGRVLMSGLFVWGGYGKLMAPGATAPSSAQV